MGANVLHAQDGRRKVGRKLRGYVQKGIHAAGGRANYDASKGRGHSHSSFSRTECSKQFLRRERVRTCILELTRIDAGWLAHVMCGRGGASDCACSALHRGNK
jgi:hypothetical protein